MILTEVYKAIHRLYLDDAFENIIVELNNDEVLITANSQLYTEKDDASDDILRWSRDDRLDMWPLKTKPVRDLKLLEKAIDDMKKYKEENPDGFTS